MSWTHSVPLWLQYTGNIVGIIGFLISLKTLQTTCSVKKQLTDKYEVKKFNAEFDQIISKINSHINSIQQDQIYKNDAVNSYSQTLSNSIVDLESSYSFLPHECTSYLKSIKSAVKQPIITSERWNNIVENLIRLRNFLEKEHNSHE